MPLQFADAIFWIAVALCVVAEIAIVRSALVARPAPVAQGVPSARRSTEVLWAVVPAIALAIVLVLTWRAIHPAPAERAPAGPAAGADAGLSLTSDRR